MLPMNRRGFYNQRGYRETAVAYVAKAAGFGNGIGNARGLTAAKLQRHTLPLLPFFLY
jgi:hypothetical protein